MTDMPLNAEALRASKAAASFVAQVRQDLADTGGFAEENLDLMASHVAAAIIRGTFDGGIKPGVLAGRLCD